MLFFFSSRRRHTRWPRDWSSDVCSSDLELGQEHPRRQRSAPPLADIAQIGHPTGQVRTQLGGEGQRPEGLPGGAGGLHHGPAALLGAQHGGGALAERDQDRKSTRLNSSHVAISYAVFCLKKK